MTRATKWLIAGIAAIAVTSAWYGASIGPQDGQTGDAVVVSLPANPASVNRDNGKDSQAQPMIEWPNDAGRTGASNASSAVDAMSDVEPQPTDETVINIGEYMDPDDPSTWPQSANQEVINIGEYMDPDDPSTWPVDESSEVVSIGVYMDPDDPSTWPVEQSSEIVNIGEPLDPERPETWPNEGGGEVVNIGEYKDPDDPSTWD